ncbi:hypothetical protein [Paenibacillus sp. UNC451MF]|uniref:hypothetical protein n=1 Tax=Paenibacillus sp. UNC451MF TaxID=1449063 RepID=UPI0012DDA4F5|nr:hypothetical protein [Paenibacillus sp. UNC451MF]
MKKTICFSLLFPLPFAIIFFMNSKNWLECCIYYGIFAAILLISLFIRRKKPKRSDYYDDYMI